MIASSASIDVVFQRDGAHVVYLNDASGPYRGRQFVTPGVQPQVTPSQGVVFVAYRDYRQHPFLAIYRNGSWSGRDLAPGAGAQQVMAVTAAGGRGHRPRRQRGQQPPLCHRRPVAGS